MGATENISVGIYARTVGSASVDVEQSGGTGSVDAAYVGLIAMGDQ